MTTLEVMPSLLAPAQVRLSNSSLSSVKGALQLGLYTILPPPILYGVWHKKGGGGGGGPILRNGRPIVLQ